VYVLLHRALKTLRRELEVQERELAGRMVPQRVTT